MNYICIYRKIVELGFKINQPPKFARTARSSASRQLQADELESSAVCLMLAQRAEKILKITKSVVYLNEKLIDCHK